jgi:hypothetical protein
LVRGGTGDRDHISPASDYHCDVEVDEQLRATRPAQFLREVLKVAVGSNFLRDEFAHVGRRGHEIHELFACLERQAFSASREQLLALAYRSICREACAKHQVVA